VDFTNSFAALLFGLCSLAIFLPNSVSPIALDISFVNALAAAIAPVTTAPLN